MKNFWNGRGKAVSLWKFPKSDRLARPILSISLLTMSSKRKYINMSAESGTVFLACLENARQWEPGQDRPEKPLQATLQLYDKSFADDENAVVIIDEIQESAEVYNLIREFTRDFKSRFIVIGSYLGRVLSPDFKMSAGDLTAVRIETLTFEEFMEAMGMGGLLAETRLYGLSEQEDYDQLRQCYDIYTQIGGYPAVVTEYLETKSIQKATLSE